jgi:hypothetical protein
MLATYKIITGRIVRYGKNCDAIKCIAHPAANSHRYVAHLVIMEQHLGRLLRPGEIVHHKDEDKRNNGLENVVLTNRSSHARHHANAKPKNALIRLVCPSCPTIFSGDGARPASSGRTAREHSARAAVSDSLVLTDGRA